jgi:hypothetical protein
LAAYHVADYARSRTNAMTVGSVKRRVVALVCGGVASVLLLGALFAVLKDEDLTGGNSEKRRTRIPKTSVASVISCKKWLAADHAFFSKAAS